MSTSLRLVMGTFAVLLLAGIGIERRGHGDGSLRAGR